MAEKVRRAIGVGYLPDEQAHAAIVSHLAKRLAGGGLLCTSRCYVCDWVTQLPLDEMLAYVPLAVEKARSDSLPHV